LLEQGKEVVFSGILLLQARLAKRDTFLRIGGLWKSPRCILVSL